MLPAKKVLERLKQRRIFEDTRRTDIKVDTQTREWRQISSSCTVSSALQAIEFLLKD
jgi:hypothetical protein